MSEVTPRITQQYLSNFIGRTVRLVGKVVELRGDHATVDARGNVTALLNRDSHLAMNSFVELVGKVNPDLTLKVLASTDFGSNVDLDLNDAVVDATHRYHEIFYERPA